MEDPPYNETSESDSTNSETEDTQNSDLDESGDEESPRPSDNDTESAIDNDSPVVIDENADEMDESDQVYLILVDNEVKGYISTQVEAFHYIRRLAKKYQSNYMQAYPNWTISLSDHYDPSEFIVGIPHRYHIELSFRYNFFIVQYESVRHRFRMQNIPRLDLERLI